MNEKEMAREILMAAGVFETLLDSLIEDYSLVRIKEVARYVVYQKQYRYPAPALVKGLQQEWDVSHGNKNVDSMKLDELLLEETNDELATSENSI